MMSFPVKHSKYCAAIIQNVFSPSGGSKDYWLCGDSQRTVWKGQYEWVVKMDGTIVGARI